MQAIATMQFKGGAGKTVLTMALASAAAAAGARTVLIDTDQNRPLTKWHKAAETLDYWQDQVQVVHHLDFEAVEAALNDLDEAGQTDFVFIDCKGGRGRFLDGICQIVDLTLIPVKPDKLDLDAAIETLHYTQALTQAGAEIAPARLAMTALRAERQMTADMRDFMTDLTGLPQMATRLRDRVAYKNMQSRGLLNSIADQRAADVDALERGQARPYREALGEVAALL
ncbi:MAG: AAA family ATPase, partial [Pseudomonadota bacterium]